MHLLIFIQSEPHKTVFNLRLCVPTFSQPVSLLPVSVLHSGSPRLLLLEICSKMAAPQTTFCSKVYRTETSFSFPELRASNAVQVVKPLGPYEYS